MKQSKLHKKVIDKLGETLGVPILYSSDCEKLSTDIRRRLNETIGVTTLKRLFGFVNDVNTPRPVTLDIIARYAGFENYEIMSRELGLGSDSGFETDPDVDSANLKPDDRVTFTYHPDRQVTLEYQGNLRFRVVESKGSSLQAGDIVIAPVFYLNQPLRIESVKRGDSNLGRYVAGKVSGITSISVVSGALTSS